MLRDLVRQVVNIAAYIAMILINALANILPLNGQQTGEISDRFPVYFVPAGYVFAIWGLIYVLLGAFVIYQALPSQRANERLRRIGFLFALSCVLNGIWIFCWHYNLFPLSLVVMVALLGTLITIYQRLNIGLEAISTAEAWLIHIPFSVYLGWISVATVANASDVLYYLGWNGQPLPPQIWAALIVVVVSALTVYLLRERRDVAYSLVIVWAFVGIFVKQMDTPIVSWVALIAAVVLGAICSRVFVRLTTPPCGQNVKT